MLKTNTRQQVSSEINSLETALLFLERAYAGRTQELAEKIGVKRPTISVLLKRRKTTKRNATALIKLWKKEAGLETDEPEAKASTESTKDRPIGHIPIKGHDRDRDWEMSVPVYADESRNDVVLASAVRLLNAVRGGTTAPKTEQKGAGDGDTPSVSESVLLSEGDGLTREFHSPSQDNVHGEHQPWNRLGEVTGCTTSDGKRP